MPQAAIFVTCLVDLFKPQTGYAAAEVMERHGWEVEVPISQTCCGQFAYNAGHFAEAIKLAQHFIEVFESANASTIVGLSASCTAMVAHEYPELFQREGANMGLASEEVAQWVQRATVMAERLMEFGEWVHGQEALALPAVKPEKVAVHHGCHMRRVLKAMQPTDEALRAYGAELVEYPDETQCCGFGGTYSMIEPTISTQLADAKREALSQAQAAGATSLISGDWGCLLHLSGRMEYEGDRWPVLHVAEWINQREKMSAQKKGE
ncbi:hypothetical protein BXT84_07870 [Sulfobacillus thermotolerans]|uniref:Cysteine-rich domain-containing protein n=1 Tax=Sulfobacillus thermotolerans TaxID=338644 RepID=A0ABN5GZX2_9FIRM|nr:hypothetical protein BXT84_07870 [Sulfobacillus thermotolerans]